MPFTISPRAFHAVIFDLDGGALQYGAGTYDVTVELIRQLHASGIKTAVVSSGRKCVQILNAAGHANLFHLKVDGENAAGLSQPGEPRREMFLRAAGELAVEADCAIVVADAITGVAAGRAGNFGAVIGVDRGGQADAMRQAGATVITPGLRDIHVAPDAPVESDAFDLPAALDSVDEVRAAIGGKRVVLFLDYDGTLTPIVARPEDAILSQGMRATIERLADRWTVAVVSGRGLSDVRTLVGVGTVFYAGSHGFEIAGPVGRNVSQEQGTKFLPVLDEVQRELEASLSEIGGAKVERKRFSVAAHYRNVPPGGESRVREAVGQVLAAHPELRVSPGKKVLDVQPGIDWNKGKAVSWLLSALDLDSCATLPLYLGDDITDEDAFREVQGRGIGIIVREERRPTFARYALNNVDEVRCFLNRLGG